MEASSSLACRHGVCPHPVLTLGGPEEGPGDAPTPHRFSATSGGSHHLSRAPQTLPGRGSGPRGRLAPWRSPWWCGQEQGSACVPNNTVSVVRCGHNGAETAFPESGLVLAQTHSPEAQLPVLTHPGA